MTESENHITCREVVELVTDYLEMELSPHETAVFEEHLNFCDGCDWYLNQMHTTIEAVGRLSEDDIPDETKEQLLTAFRDWKRA